MDRKMSPQSCRAYVVTSFPFLRPHLLGIRCRLGGSEPANPSTDQVSTPPLIAVQGSPVDYRWIYWADGSNGTASSFPQLLAPIVTGRGSHLHGRWMALSNCGEPPIEEPPATKHFCFVSCRAPPVALLGVTPGLPEKGRPTMKGARMQANMGADASLGARLPP